MTVLEVSEGLYEKIEETNAGTRYVVHAIRLDHGELLCAVESGWGGNYGEWILLGQASVAWSYLREKMPETTKRPGDAAGWAKAFKAAGIDVFGWQHGRDDDDE